MHVNSQQCKYEFQRAATVRDFSERIFTAVNEGLIAFKGGILFASHDHEFIQTIADRIIEIHPDGTITDKVCTYDEYISE